MALFVCDTASELWCDFSHPSLGFFFFNLLVLSSFKYSSYVKHVKDSICILNICWVWGFFFMWKAMFKCVPRRGRGKKSCHPSTGIKTDFESLIQTESDC